MLLSTPTAAPMANPHAHSRRRPKLSLQIAPPASPAFTPPTPSRHAMLSPTTRNTQYNARPDAYSASSYTSSSASSDSSYSSSSSDESDDGIPKTPRSRRHHMSAYQPTTPGASFGSSNSFGQKSERRSKREHRGDRRVQFRDEEPVVFYREYDDALYHDGEKPLLRMKKF